MGVWNSTMDNRVFIARCDTYEVAEAAVNRVLDAFGGATAILCGKKNVLIKPNLVMPRKPEAGATTHPAIVSAVCAAFVKAGAVVSIIDSTGAPHRKSVLRMLYGRSGMIQAAEVSGAVLSYNVKSRTVSVPNGRILKEVTLLAPVLDADLVITIGKAKTHSSMAMTGCTKNLYGCVPGLGKPALHSKFPVREDFAGVLVDICEAVAPGFSILDGVLGMEGAGPTGGDPKYLGVIAGGFNSYTIDLAQCHLMGLRIDTAHIIAEAASRGLAPCDPRQLEWLGDDPEALRQQFIPAVRQNGGAVPAILENCIGCGACARICPQKCIAIKARKAVITTKDCIRCYCCHEFCPSKAIGIE